MAYIGKTPVIGNFVKLDSITAVNGQAAYTMQNGGVNFTSYDNVNQFLVSLNGVLQAPTDSFTVSGSTLTFASNLSTGDVIDFVLVLGNSLDIGTPSDNTVTAAKIASDAVTTAKINDNAVTSAKMFSSFANGITEIDNWRLTADTTANGDITSNWERNDSNDFSYLGTGMTESSGIFSFPSTGKYLIILFGDYKSNAKASMSFNLLTTIDNSTYTFRIGVGNASSSTNEYNNSSASYVLNVDNITNVKAKFETSGFDGTPILRGNTSQNETNVLFIKLSD